MHKVCNFIIKYSIYALVFLLPLFWLPWTIEAYEFNKQYLLVFLVGLAFVTWLTKMVVVQKKVVFKRTPLDVWVLIFMAVMASAAIFSVDKISSWLGFYGRFSDSAIGLLSLCVMYFVVVNNTIKKKKILNLFLFSSIIATITAYFSIFNVWSKIPGLPGIMSLRSFNPVSGSLEGLSIFLTAMVALVIGMILQRTKTSKAPFIVYYSFLVLTIFLLIMIDFWASWVVLGIVMLILLIMAFRTRVFQKKVNLLILPVVLLIISGCFLTIDTRPFLSTVTLLKPSIENMPQELILNNEINKEITWQTIKEYPVLGSGQGTFIADFAKFKPTEFNQSNVWNIRFDKAPSHLMEVIATTGILGILSYLILICIFLLIGFALFYKKKLDNLTKKHLISAFPFVLAWLSLLVAQFVYLGNTVLYFFFWFMTALLIVVWQKSQGKKLKKISFSFEKLPEVGLVMNIILLILFFGLISLFYLGGRFYLAEIKFIQPAETNTEVVQRIEKAVNLNKYRVNYRRSLSQAYLISAWDEANKAEQEQNTQLLQAYASGAIQQARFAVTLSPNSVAAWENLGTIYRDSSGLVGGTLPFALEAYAKAVELEPTNPFFYRELCRLNLISEGKDWDKTVEYCQRAIDLKENYLDAHIQLALVYEQKGELEAALEQMKSVLDKLKGVSFQRGSDLAGAATEIYFQMGRLYFNLNHIDEAISMFEQAVIITPGYANGRYALGLSYQANGRSEDALIQFKIVDQLVPGNENIQALIQQLEMPE